MAVIELHSIHKSFRRGFWGVHTQVLKGLDLSIEPGEVYGFLGHNGAGKSTTMKVALGLLRPDRGRVVLFGEDGATSKTRARIGYLGEEVKTALVEHGGVYFGAIGGTGALLASAIRELRVVAFAELQTEAMRRMRLDRFPAVVLNDVVGGDLYARATREGRRLADSSGVEPAGS